MKIITSALVMILTGIVLAQPLLAQEVVETKPTSDVTTEDEDSGPVEKWETEGEDDDFSAIVNDRHGVGVGIASLSLPGLMIYYDYNQPKWVFEDKRAQFHYQLATVRGEDKDDKGLSTAGVRQTQLSASVRLLNVQGVYVGAGFGLQQTRLKDSPSQVDHKGSSMFGFFEGGWQGDDGFYLQIGIRPAFHLTKAAAVNTSGISDENGHKESVSRLWRWSQELSGMILGFGWYLS